MGAVTGAVRTTLRLEGLALLAIAVLGYARLGYGWPTFLWCFLLPDLAFAGYLGGARVGAVVYNLTHSKLGPALLAALGLWLTAPRLLQAALIWFAHIGFDRALGYGLKYASGFADTHLGRIGRHRQESA
jgi:hypothetical protein